MLLLGFEVAKHQLEFACITIPVRVPVRVPMHKVLVDHVTNFSREKSKPSERSCHLRHGDGLDSGRGRPNAMEDNGETQVKRLVGLEAS